METKETANALKLNKIYLFDDANESSKEDRIIKKLKRLMKDFFVDYLDPTTTDPFEVYVGGQVYMNNDWQLINNGNDRIGYTEYTKELLKDKLKKAFSKQDSVLLIDYYLVDNPIGDNVETAFNYLKRMLIMNKKNLTDNRVRILFYSAWPNPNMGKDIRELEIPNIYCSRIDFTNDIEIIKYNFKEFFRVVSIKEKPKKDN